MSWFRQILRLPEKRLPVILRRVLRHLTGHAPPVTPIGAVSFGDFRRLMPICPNFGYGRGQPIDRHYIEKFLALHSLGIKGHVLEVKDNSYTRRFGGGRVTRESILDVTPANPMATYVADLAYADNIPADTFDCIILTQTLHLIYDYKLALSHLHRMLKPGGVLLVTVPGISQIDQGACRDIWHWSFTGPSVNRMFADSFGKDGFCVAIYGNVLTAVGFLHGLTTRELTFEELDNHDPAYPVTIAVRAVKLMPEKA